jgi:hypothetical protein
LEIQDIGPGRKEELEEGDLRVLVLPHPGEHLFGEEGGPLRIKGRKKRRREEKDERGRCHQKRQIEGRMDTENLRTERMISRPFGSPTKNSSLSKCWQMEAVLKSGLWRMRRKRVEGEEKVSYAESADEKEPPPRK